MFHSKNRRPKEGGDRQVYDYAARRVSVGKPDYRRGKNRPDSRACCQLQNPRQADFRRKNESLSARRYYFEALKYYDIFYRIRSVKLIKAICPESPFAEKLNAREKRPEIFKFIIANHCPEIPKQIVQPPTDTPICTTLCGRQQPENQYPTNLFWHTANLGKYTQTQSYSQILQNKWVFGNCYIYCCAASGLS